MAAAEEYDHAEETQQDGLQAKQNVQKSNLNASSDVVASNSSGASMCVEIKESAPAKKTTTKKKKKNRCQFGSCNKKLKKRSRAFLACRCGGIFCADHRLQCDHDCTYEKPQVKNVKSAKFDSLQERM